MIRQLRLGSDERGITTAEYAVGTAAGNELFPPKTDAAPTTVPGPDGDRGFIDEVHERGRYEAERTETLLRSFPMRAN